MPDNALKLPALLSLFVITLVCVVILFAVESLTTERIKENSLSASRRIFNDIIPAGYTNDIYNDGLSVVDKDYFGTQKPVSINRIRINEEITGVLIYPVTANGYKSEIQLAIGINRDGTISGTRVLHENETSGLGDQVHQDKSDWIDMFFGKSSSSYTRNQWRVISDGGDFDEISGATITSRSVINAVKSALDYHELSSDIIYSEK